MLQFPKMVSVTEQLGNENMGFVNMCVVLIQQSGRCDDDVDLDDFFSSS